MKKTGILIVIILLVYGCCYSHHELKIVNDSNETISYETYFHDNLSKEDIYNKYSKVYYLDGYNILKPGDSARPPSQNTWSYSIQTLSKDHTLSVAFFNKDSIEKFGWDKLIELKKYNIYTYKISELEKLKWVIVYKGKPNG